MDSVVDQAIRDIVRQEIAESLNGHSGDPELLTVAETLNYLNRDRDVTEDRKIGRETLGDLIKDSPANGFPAVRLGVKTVLIDKARLNRWLATGGLGVVKA